MFAIQVTLKATYLIETLSYCLITVEMVPRRELLDAFKAKVSVLAKRCFPSYLISHLSAHLYLDKRCDPNLALSIISTVTCI